jgi:hypothetical protein
MTLARSLPDSPTEWRVLLGVAACTSSLAGFSPGVRRAATVTITPCVQPSPKRSLTKRTRHCLGGRDAFLSGGVPHQEPPPEGGGRWGLTVVLRPDPSVARGASDRVVRGECVGMQDLFGVALRPPGRDEDAGSGADVTLVGQGGRAVGRCAVQRGECVERAAVMSGVEPGSTSETRSGAPSGAARNCMLPPMLCASG